MRSQYYRQMQVQSGTRLLHCTVVALLLNHVNISTVICNASNQHIFIVYSTATVRINSHKQIQQENGN